MKKFFRNLFLVLVNLIVFVIAWLLLGNLAETLIRRYMDSAIHLPQAFAWGAINAFVSFAAARVIEYGVDHVIWGDDK